MDYEIPDSDREGMEEFLRVLTETDGAGPRLRIRASCLGAAFSSLRDLSQVASEHEFTPDVDAILEKAKLLGFSDSLPAQVLNDIAARVVEVILRRHSNI